MRDVSYSFFQKALHWLVAFLLVLQWWTSDAVIRTHMPHRLGHRPSSYDLTLHQLHVWVGVSVAVLVVARLFLRWRNGVPPHPANLPIWEAVVARSAHALIYVVLFGLVATGIATTYFWFGVNIVHRLLVYSLYVLVSVHVIAVVGADVWRGAGLMRRMTPNWNQRKG